MARKTKDEAEKTKERILESALDLFVEKGYEKTTFTEIAARLQLTKGAVYWHFESKEQLLVALVDELLEKFEKGLIANRPLDALDFAAASEMMACVAEKVVSNAKDRAFFLLLKTQVRWGEETMRETRERLMTNDRVSPFHAFVTAVENGKRDGTVRGDADSTEVAHIAISMWDGLVQSKIDGFLRTDLKTTLLHGFAAVFGSIRKN